MNVISTRMYQETTKTMKGKPNKKLAYNVW